MDVDIVERVTGTCYRNESPRDHARSASTHAHPVQRDPEQVGHRVIDRIDPIPSFPEFQERVLHQFFRVGRAPGDEVQRSVQTIVHGEEELFEIQRTRGYHAFPTELDDVVLCLHAPMDARAIEIV